MIKSARVLRNDAVDGNSAASAGVVK